MPSRSESYHSSSFIGNISSVSAYPSLSSSSSIASQVRSLSKSAGILFPRSGSEPHSNSSESVKPSPSSSESALLPILSLSVSSHSDESRGKVSFTSSTLSPSSSISNESQRPSESVSTGTLLLSSGSLPQSSSVIS